MTILSAIQPERSAPRAALRLVPPVGDCAGRLGPLRCVVGADHEFGCVFHASSGSYLDPCEINED